jgi:hypothetical protein
MPLLHEQDTEMTTITVTGPADPFAAVLSPDEVRFPYDRALVELLKDSVPYDEREWEPSRKVWKVEPGYYLETFLSSAVYFGHEVRDLRKEQEAPPPPPQEPSPSWADALFQAVGPERSNAVYRALSRVLHPDTEHGDHELMVQLTDARQKANS